MRPKLVDDGTRATLPPNSLQGVSVLVVDNEADARELVATLLRAHGAEVVAAASAEEALAQLEKAMPQVTVDDVAAFHDRSTAGGANVTKPLCEEPWGMREFGLRTVDGHRIMIGQRVRAPAG